MGFSAGRKMPDEDLSDVASKVLSVLAICLFSLSISLAFSAGIIPS